MTDKHLLYWIFKHLDKDGGLDVFVKAFPYDQKWSENATQTIKETLSESIKEYKKIK